jgi:hypothetical protein
LRSFPQACRCVQGPELREEDWAEDVQEHDCCEKDGDERGHYFLGHGCAIKDDGESVAWMGLNFPKEEFKEGWRKSEGA